MWPTIAESFSNVDTGIGRRQRLVSVSIPCRDIDPLQALAQESGRERFYWQDPRAGVTYVGVGVAADLRAWGTSRFQSIAGQAADLFAHAHLARETPTFAEPHLFGGFAFSDDFTPDNTWSVYHPAQFILPHYQLAVQSNSPGHSETWLTINALLDVATDEPAGDEDIAATNLATSLHVALAERVAQLQAAQLLLPALLPTLQSRQYPMSYPSWECILQQAIERFRTGELSKVVLSRVCELRFANNVDVVQALDYLNRSYPDCYRFVFEPQPYHAFFGASPELLVNLRGKQVNTMGLAGSEPRGISPAEDDMLGEQLLHSPKDRHEHQLVVDALCRRLKPFCSELHIAEQPQLLKLNNIQHLYTPVQGTLDESQNILGLLAVLHPTPALGGVPRLQALDYISRSGAGAARLVPRRRWGSLTGIWPVLLL